MAAKSSKALQLGRLRSTSTGTANTSEVMDKNERKSRKGKHESYYAVEKILARKIEHGKCFYFLKWENYPESCNSWEPAENLGVAMIQEYEARQLREMDEMVSIVSSKDTVVDIKEKTEVKGGSRTNGLKRKSAAAGHQLAAAPPPKLRNGGSSRRWNSTVAKNESTGSDLSSASTALITQNNLSDACQQAKIPELGIPDDHYHLAIRLSPPNGIDPLVEPKSPSSSSSSFSDGSAIVPQRELSAICSPNRNNAGDTLSHEVPAVIKKTQTQQDNELDSIRGLIKGNDGTYVIIKWKNDEKQLQEMVPIGVVIDKYPTHTAHFLLKLFEWDKYPCNTIKSLSND